MPLPNGPSRAADNLRDFLNAKRFAEFFCRFHERFCFVPPRFLPRVVVPWMNLCKVLKLRVELHSFRRPILRKKKAKDCEQKKPVDVERGPK